LIHFYKRYLKMATASTSKLTIPEKVAEATRYKEAGNSLYKEKKYKAAAGKYHRALLYLKGIDVDLHGTPAFLQEMCVHPGQQNTMPPELEQQCIQLNISVHNNLCACMLLMENSNLERIKHLAEVVIELDDKNEKAWFRKGQAAVKLKDLDCAHQCFKKVQELSNGSNQEADRLLRDIEHKLQHQKDKEKKMYQNMFG